MKWINVTQIDEFAPNTSQVFTVADTKILVFNLDGEFYAMEDACTHEDKSLAGGQIDGDQVTCPWHGARFDIKTGEALCAPAYDPVTTFGTRVQDGMVQVAWNGE